MVLLYRYQIFYLEKNKAVLKNFEENKEFANYKEMNGYLKNIEAEWLKTKNKEVKTYAMYTQK